MSGTIFMIFGYVVPQYLRNEWTNFCDFWICFSSISMEWVDQFSWFLDMLFLNISGMSGPISMIFGLVVPPNLRNVLTNFHEFWICFPPYHRNEWSVSFMNFDMFFLNILGTIRPIFIIFGVVFQTLTRGFTSFREKRHLSTMPLGINKYTQNFTTF